MRKMDAMVKEMPSNVKIDAYIDDLALSAAGPKSRVAADIVKAQDILKRILTVELGCSLAQQKAAIVASDREVGRGIAKAINNEEALTASAANLGIDATAGGTRRRIGRGSKRNARFKSTLGRGGRLWAVSKVLG